MTVPPIGSAIPARPKGLSPGPARTKGQELREVSSRSAPLRRLVEVWQHRELLVNLVRKDLRIRYKSSVLGFLWTLLNPALYLVVFSLVFQEILRTNVPYYAVFLLSGLLVWNLFANSVSGATTAIVGNAGLVQKVWFPRQILPVAAVGAALVHFVFQLVVLVAALVVFTKAPAWDYLPLVVPALLVLLVLALGIGIALSAINVYLRDTQHLLELVLLAWFWLSAIVYPYRDVADRLGDRSELMLLNPIISLVLVFQRAIYNPPLADGVLPDAGALWYLRNLALVGAGSLAVLYVGLRIFGRLEDDFAEEI